MVCSQTCPCCPISSPSSVPRCREPRPALPRPDLCPCSRSLSAVQRGHNRRQHDEIRFPTAPTPFPPRSPLAVRRYDKPDFRPGRRNMGDSLGPWSKRAPTCAMRRALAACTPHRRAPFDDRQAFGEPRLDQPPAHGKIRVFGRQSHHAAHVFRQHHPAVDRERMCPRHLPEHVAQRADMPRQQVVAMSLQGVDREEVGSPKCQARR